MSKTMTRRRAAARPEQLARRSDPDTSHAAAERAARFAKSHDERILAVLEETPGLTAEEIGRRCGLAGMQVSRRMAHLHRQSRVERTGEQRRTVAGLPAAVWRIT